MHIAIPFDIETVKQSWGQAARMWGRVMANQTFLKALAGAKACSRLSLIVPGRQDVDLLNKTLMASFGDHQAKVSAVPFARLAAHLQGSPIDVLHMLDPNMWLGAHIRSRLSRNDFPITGVTHSLGNQHFLEWVLLNNANGVRADDCLVCSTPTAQEVVQSIFRRLGAGQPRFTVPATTVIPLGVSVARFAGSRADSRAHLAMDTETFVVLSLARFNPQFKMDLQPLLRLASLAGERIKRPLRLILAGSSGDGNYVRFMQGEVRSQGLEKQVEFMPDPDETAKIRLLRAADVFLSLSDNIQETFGLTPIEGMAAGVPVVASDWNGYRSLIEDGISGFLVPTRSLAPDAAWEAVLALRYDSLVHLFSAQTTAVDLDVACGHLVRLAEDPALRERMGAAAGLRARAFDWDLVIGQYIQLWERLLAARAPGQAEVSPGDASRTSALRFAEDFASYASSELRVDDRFRTTQPGKALLKGRTSVHFHPETDEFLDIEIMAGILERCVDGRSVGQLAQVLQSAAPGGTVQISQNILWLYKCGYLRALV